MERVKTVQKSGGACLERPITPSGWQQSEDMIARLGGILYCFISGTPP